jgi:RNA polymerase sigma-70 factor (ECF subfamily)
MPKFLDPRHQAVDHGSPPESQDEDRALLARAASGDEVAVRRLYRNHIGKLQRHAARILGATDPDVEDVVQQAFLAALDGAAKFDGRSSVQTWLFGIVTRRALDSARARYRRHRFSRILASVGLTGHDQPSPDHTYQTANEIERMLATLSPLQRVVFVLHDIEGYTFAEISGLTDVGISTLHGRLLAARKCIDDQVVLQARIDAEVYGTGPAHNAHDAGRTDRRTRSHGPLGDDDA